MFWLRRQVNKLRNKPSRTLNVAMFHSGRCGSTVLGNLLNQHSLVRWGDEVFEVPYYKKLLASGVKPLDMIDFDMYKSASPIYGLETKALRELHLRPEFLDLSLADYVGWLETRGFTKFITLNRKNYLRRVVSALGLRERGITHMSAQRSAVSAAPLDVANVPIGIANMRLIAYFELLDKHYAQLHDVLKTRDALVLTYEDDIASNPVDGYKRVCAFLDIEPQEVQVKLARTNPGELSSLIQNYDEVATLLSGTRYAWMLND